MEIKSIYDNGGKTLDRYTIVTTIKRKHRDGHWLYNCICSSENGLGVFMWGECMVGRHLGKKIQLEDLSKELQQRIKNELA